MKKQADGGLAPERGYLTQKIMEMEEIRNDSMPLCYIKEYKELIGERCWKREGGGGGGGLTRG